MKGVLGIWGNRTGLARIGMGQTIYRTKERIKECGAGTQKESIYSSSCEVMVPNRCCCINLSSQSVSG